MENKKVLIGNFKSYMTFGDIKNYLRIIDNKIVVKICIDVRNTVRYDKGTEYCTDKEARLC